MDKLDFFNITSSIIAFSSLIISLAALCVSRRLLVLASREYKLLIDIQINDDDEVLIVNKDKDLFSIIQVAYIKVDIVGFEDTEKGFIVSIPLVTVSRMQGDFETPAAITINSTTAYALAYLPPLPKQEMEAIFHRVTHCKQENPAWVTLPSHCSVVHYIEILYENKFHDQKYAIFQKEHFHGSGYRMSSVTEDEFGKVLRRIGIPTKLSGETLWKYLVEHFRYT